MSDREIDPNIFIRITSSVAGKKDSSSASSSVDDASKTVTISINDSLSQAANNRSNSNNHLNVNGGEGLQLKRPTRTSFNLDSPPVFIIPNDQAEQSEGVRPRVYSIYECQSLEWSKFISI